MADGGADIVVAQGHEAGGHTGRIGTLALVPQVVDAVAPLPVVAAGGIGDGRTAAAAFTLGASAVAIGSALLRCPETELPDAWANSLEHLDPEGTMLTRAFSGRAGRAIATDYVRAASAPDAPVPAPYPVQRALTAAMRAEAVRRDDVNGMQVWAGQGAALARAEPAADVVQRIWSDAVELMRLA